MKLTVLGSSSSGNCYLLEGTKQAIVIEAGINFREVQKAIDFNIRKIRACLISHAHSDHSKYADSYDNRGIPIYSVFDVVKKLKGTKNTICEYDSTYAVGEFLVKSFRLFHDVPCLGFIVFHPEMGHMAFITDTGKIPYIIPNLRHVLIESNYSDSIIQRNALNGHYNHAHASRLPNTHLSINKAAKWLKQHKKSIETVVLLHLSNENSNEAEFISKIESETGLKTHVAKAGLQIELNRYSCNF